MNSHQMLVLHLGNVWIKVMELSSYIYTNIFKTFAYGSTILDYDLSTDMIGWDCYCES